MKTIKYFLFLLLIVIIGFCLYVAVQPNSFKVSRTQTIEAPTSVIYNEVIDFKNWPQWWSWSKDTAQTKLYPATQTKGLDGSLSWEDPDGVGTIKNLSTIPNSNLLQDVQMADFPPSSISWNFSEKEEGTTNVTYSIAADNLPFTFKMLAVLNGNMETQLGPKMEQTLRKLDATVIKNMNAYSITVNGITEHGGGYYIFSSTASKISEIHNRISELFAQVKHFAEENHISIAGSPFVYYHYLDRENNAAMISCCLPTTDRVITTDPDILTGQLKPFACVKTTLIGHHNYLKKAWETTFKYMTDKQLTLDENGPKLETYIIDETGSPNPADWKTEIYIALKD